MTTDQKLPCIAAKEPCALEMEPGRYFWCTCGLSKEQPFCDGAHKGTDFRPQLVEITEKKKVWWCQCKHSKDGHECDGTHNDL